MTTEATAQVHGAVLAAAVCQVEMAVREPALRRTLVDALERFAGGGHMTAAQIPLLVHTAITGDATPAVPLGAVALLVHLGVDLLDDVMDGDATLLGGPESYPRATLAGSLLTGPLTFGASRQLCPAGAMQRVLADGLTEMAGGQWRDIAGRGFEISPAEVESIVAAKSGAFVAMLARMAAMLARAQPDVLEAWTEWGRALGTAEQLRSDCLELLTDPSRRDLRRRAPNLAVALLLEATSADKRDAVLAVIAAAGTDDTAFADLRALMREAHALAQCAITIERYCLAARDALARASPRPETVGALNRQLDAISVFASARRPTTQGRHTMTGMSKEFGELLKEFLHEDSPVHKDIKGRASQVERAQAFLAKAPNPNELEIQFANAFNWDLDTDDLEDTLAYYLEEGEDGIWSLSSGSLVIKGAVFTAKGPDAENRAMTYARLFFLPGLRVTVAVDPVPLVDRAPDAGPEAAGATYTNVIVRGSVTVH